MWREEEGVTDDVGKREQKKAAEVNDVLGRYAFFPAD